MLPGPRSRRRARLAPRRPGRGLLLTQAQFAWTTGPDGKRAPKPGPAKLVMLHAVGDRFSASVLEDPESRVFHKAVCLPDGRLLTIGATDAHLKTWKHAGGTWQGTSQWRPTFGGTWNRLRDFEFGDVDGDGADELVIGTHDQGVLVVAESQGEGFAFKEIDRRAETFIHEVEIGDVDGDGKREIYATPSEPNKADRSQGGEVAAYIFDAQAYRKETVARFADRHAKEIRVLDADADGQDELYVALEARSDKEGAGVKVHEPLEIQRYRKVAGAWKSETVAVLEKGLQARVLLWGALRGERPEMVVTTFKDGVWLLTPGATLPWAKQPIDAESSGFEHAASLADLNGDGRPELYVAADDQNEVRRYVWQGEHFERTVIHQLGESDLTWSIEGCAAPKK